MRCNMNKVQLNIISIDKDGSFFCTGPLCQLSGPPFSDQGHGMTLNIILFSDKPP